MLKGQFNGLTAARLRVVLSFTIVLLIGVSIASFWFFRSQLELYANQVQAANAAASVSSNDVSRLKQLQQDLDNDKVAVNRAKNIVAESKSYQYQDQILTDITAYAKASGVVLTSVTFNEQNTPGTPTPTGPAGSVTAQPAPAGLKSITTTIAIRSPVNYAAIMRFVHSIEVNLTKMQLTGVSFLRQGGTSQDVVINPLTIQVYTR